MFAKFFYSKQLQPKEGALRKGEIALSTAVEEYMQSITQGNYDPELPEINWSNKEESSYIGRLLSPVSEYFKTLHIPPSFDASVPVITHLLASLTILNELHDVKVDDRFKKLEKMGVMTQVQAGMPGPCMIYIHALLKSSKYDAISKINLLGDVIGYMSSNMNTFGALGSTILTFALNEWFTMFNRLNNKLKIILSAAQEDHTTLQKRCSKEEQEEMTFVDQCILQVWTALGIDVSAVGLAKEDFPAPPPSPSSFGTNGSL